jgi:hypothetical protein
MFILAGCGEEYYATPELTLQKYVENRMMGNRQELEACLNSFTQQDREWYEKNYVKICVAAYGRDCPGEGLSTETTVWTDMFEPAGPKTAEVDSSVIDEDNDTATLVVGGVEYYFVKKRGNWKIDGLFGVPEKLAEKYPELKSTLMASNE